MNKQKLWKSIVGLFLILFYLFIGILVIIFANREGEKGGYFCGIIIIITSIIHILLYLLNGGYKIRSKGYYLVLGIVGVSLGIAIAFNQKMTISEICLYWGIFDIVRSSLEIKDGIYELKADKLILIEIVASIMELVLGILLCIHVEEGIAIHLIFIGVSFMLSALRIGVSNLIKFLKSKKNSASN